MKKTIPIYLFSNRNDVHPANVIIYGTDAKIVETIEVPNNSAGVNIPVSLLRESKWVGVVHRKNGKAIASQVEIPESLIERKLILVTEKPFTVWKWFFYIAMVMFSMYAVYQKFEFGSYMEGLGFVYAILMTIEVYRLHFIPLHKITFLTLKEM